MRLRFPALNSWRQIVVMMLLATAYFVAADACCDTVPPTDDACLLKLPAIAPPPKDLEDLETGE